MLTGTPPFSLEGATEFSIKDAHVRSMPPPLTERNPYLSPAVERVVLKCMEKDPANRFQTCHQVMSALDEAISIPALALAASATRRSHSLAAAPVYAPPPPAYATPPPAYVPPPAHVTPPPPPSAPEPVRRNNTKLFALIGGAVVLAAAAAFFFFWPSPETVLRLEGSANVGNDLAPALLRAFARHEGGTNISVQSNVIDDSSGNKATQSQVRANMPGKWRPEVFQVLANESGNAFKALQGKTAEIGMASRRIDDKQVKELADIGDMRSPASEMVLGLDGIAVIVNRANPVAMLTRQQVTAIFSGRIADWSAVGGQPGAIHLYGGNPASGAFDTFVTLALAGDKKAFSPDLHVKENVKENGEAVAGAVASDPGGAGYVALSRIGPAKAVAVSDGAGTSALMPTPFNVATEDYVLSRRLYLYLPRNPSPMARRFAAFAEGPDGQDVVKQINFVEQKGGLIQQSVPASAPEKYRQLTAGRRRMTFDFRFEPGGDELDNKALADVERAVSSLSALSIKDVYLLGFGDNGGTYQKDLELSRDRAIAVGKRLQERGLNVYTEGFSSEMPVADNSTDDGRSKNRRVEVWVKG
jgi:phosphate transport system substrate-binding protein